MGGVHRFCPFSEFLRFKIVIFVQLFIVFLPVLCKFQPIGNLHLGALLICLILRTFQIFGAKMVGIFYGFLEISRIENRVCCKSRVRHFASQILAVQNGTFLTRGRANFGGPPFGHRVSYRDQTWWTCSSWALAWGPKAARPTAHQFRSDGLSKWPEKSF